MIGPPSCTAEAFKKPLLRPCPFDLDTISWEACIGGGADGYVWKVKFGDQGPFALKMFWDTEPLDRPYPLSYYAIQRECHNTALLQMIETSVAQATPESPIVVIADPATRTDAIANLRVFSEDDRLHQQQKFAKYSIPTKTISQIPRIKKCYGWLNLSSKRLNKLPWEMRAPHITIDKLKRFIQHNKDYMAIVYEYVEDGENDPAVVEQMLEFLWLAGFSLTGSPLGRNWTSGVLIDYCDIVPPRGYGWMDRYYGRKNAEYVLRSWFKLLHIPKEGSDKAHWSLGIQQRLLPSV